MQIDLNRDHFGVRARTLNAASLSRQVCPRAYAIVKITLNLPLLRCMLFADYSHNFHPIVMKFGKHYFLV